MKTQLVQAPNNYGETRSSGCYPPLGLLSIATYIFYNSVVGTTKPEILDGEIMSFGEISSRLNAEVIGFSVNLLNAQNSVKLSEIAKARGAKVVWGGPHPTARWQQILKNQKFIDYVVVGDGEQAFANIIRGDIQASPNIAHSGREKVLHLESCLDSYPLPEYALLPEIETYISNFQKQEPGVRMLNVYSHRGCAFRLERGPCIFCCIKDRKLRFRRVDLFTENILRLQKDHKVTHLRDCGDSVTASKHWLREFAQLVRDVKSPNFYIYARADEIDEEVVALLAAIKTELVYLGGESGDDSILQATRKKETRGQILKATQLLGSQGIKARISFIAGLPGESQKSLVNTEEFIKELIQLPNVVYIPFSIILPLPGSPLFGMMESKFPDLRKDDVFEIEHLQELWVDNFCSVSFGELKERYHQIKSLNASKFDRGLGEKN